MLQIVEVLVPKHLEHIQIVLQRKSLMDLVLHLLVADSIIMDKEFLPMFMQVDDIVPVLEKKENAHI